MIPGKTILSKCQYLVLGVIISLYKLLLMPLTASFISQNLMLIHCKLTIITPVLQQEIQQTIFIGYINDLHYVSTVTHSNSQLRNRLKYLKRKYSVSEYDKEKKLEKRRANYKKQLSEESAEKKQERLAKMRASYNKRCSEETAEKKQERLAKRRANYKKQAFQQPVKERQEKLINTEQVKNVFYFKLSFTMFYSC